MAARGPRRRPPCRVTGAGRSWRPGGPVVQCRRQCVPRCTTDPLAKPVNEPCGHQPPKRLGQGKDRLGEGREPIANSRQEFPAAEPVGQSPRKNLCDAGSGFCQALDEANGEYRGSEHRDHVDRESALIISEEMSMNMLTSPRAQMPLGMAPRCDRTDLLPSFTRKSRALSQHIQVNHRITLGALSPRIVSRCASRSRRRVMSCSRAPCAAA